MSALRSEQCHVSRLGSKWRRPELGWCVSGWGGGLGISSQRLGLDRTPMGMPVRLPCDLSVPGEQNRRGRRGARAPRKRRTPPLRWPGSVAQPILRAFVEFCGSRDKSEPTFASPDRQRTSALSCLLRTARKGKGFAPVIPDD